MKWIETRVRFDVDAMEPLEDLIADVFFELGLKGVLIDDPRIQPLEGWAVAAPCPSEAAVSGYFPDRGDWLDTLRSLKTKLHQLQRRCGFRCRISWQRIDEADWAEAWKTFFHPVRIADNIVVKPNWQPFEARPGDIVLKIDPGMAFGTGTHATTVMCIRRIRSHLSSGGYFLDVGTGSGILMIAAAKLGAAYMVGVDDDPDAVVIARQNLRLNGVPDDRCGLLTGHLAAAVKGRFHLIAANILTKTIVELLPAIPHLLTENGRVILSGITANNRPVVEKKIHAAGLGIIGIDVVEGWLCLVAENHRDSYSVP